MYRIPCEYTNIIYCYTLPNFAEYANLDNITHTKNEELKEQERNKLMCRACNFKKGKSSICAYVYTYPSVMENTMNYKVPAVT